MNHESDLIAAFAVLFLTVMLWAYAVDRPGALSSLLTLGTMQSGIVETDGE
jgi:hypothetical protein